MSPLAHEITTQLQSGRLSVVQLLGLLALTPPPHMLLLTSPLLLLAQLLLCDI